MNVQEDVPPRDQARWREWVKDRFRNVSQCPSSSLSAAGEQEEALISQH
jgi:hypothetical protein